MFSALIRRFRTSVAEVKSVVDWQDSLRDTLNNPSNPAPRMTLSATSLGALQARAPNRIVWQTFDHCAAVTRLYALFEDVVSDLVVEYADHLPLVYPTYASLRERLRIQHRVGVGLILTKWSTTNPLYKSLAERDIAAGLADGLRANAYRILADAFLVSPENFRFSALSRLFGDLGFSDAMSFVKKSDQITLFLQNRLSSRETVESYLDGFIQVRNEASHGTISAVVSAREITNYADFLTILIDVLALLLRSDLIKSGVASGRSIAIGEVIHVFSRNIVGVNAIESCTISVGQRLYVGKRGIDTLQIASIQTGNTPHRTLPLTAGSQLGIGFDRPCKLGARIYQWIP